MIDLTEQEIAIAKKVFETSDSRFVEIRGGKIHKKDFWAKYYKIENINEVGALNFVLGLIESVFNNHRAGNSGVEKKVDRAFLDCGLVDAAIDCTDTIEKTKMLAEFDKI
jgi:hypothetical protein